MQKFAHSLEGKDERDWEPLAHHLTAVGKRAAEFAVPFGASTLALAMGLLHDIGKCSEAYQAYIRMGRKPGGPKGPDHSSAGAKQSCTLYGEGLGRLMAFGIAGHHSGLMDGSGHGAGDLNGRLTKELERHDDWHNHVIDLPSASDLHASIAPPKANAIDRNFSVAFLPRMLFSALVDADFLETERFYAQAKGEAPPARGGMLTLEHRDTVRVFLDRHRRADTPVNQLRSSVLDHANCKAALNPGLFTLTVPTGGGKTLTSLSFAMEHALTHGLRRIIYVIPFTSIIEQTAKIFREDVALGDAVLEHHSSFDWDEERPGNGNDMEGEGAAGLAKLRRDSENWDAPIVVTTAVQFFESLFAARTSQARKLHNMAGSVIILDEAQSIPVKLLRPCMAAIDELAKNYGATVILCTATQPALRTQDGALPKTPKGVVEGLDIDESRELAPDPQGLYEKLRRVAVEWRREPVDDAEITARFADQPQMLCIVNSRGHARILFEAIREQPGAVHLTTLMCAKHRRVVLEKLRGDLAKGKPVRLVATSLIEAGVDISFPEVWRAAAGLSSIAQAAGRCNRSGELGPLGAALGRTVVFESAAHKLPSMIAAFYQPARNVLRREGLDVLGLEAISDYFRWLYWGQGYAALDAATLDEAPFPIIPAISNTARSVNFPFARISRAFRMIDDAMDPVIIPWDGPARSAIAALLHSDRPPRGVQRTLQQYVVTIPSNARTSLLASGAVQPIRPDLYGDRFIVLENRSLYGEEIGLRLDDPSWRSAESNVIG